MASDTFASFNAKVSRLQKELGDDATMHEIGKMAKTEATKAASNDLGGDPMFSGWPKKLDTRYDIIGKGVLSFHPTRRSAGPWTVAEIGRNASQGPRLRSSAFTPTGRRRSASSFRRWNGVTAGKGTATDAIKAIDGRVSKIVEQRVGRAIRRTF